MISRIHIKNFAIIEETDIDFSKDLCIITGETGSGKSIIAHAISLALGARADSSYVRTGADKALIQMICEYQHEDYIVTREISTTGKNICKINGEIVTLTQLKNLTAKVADIHGQFDTQMLLDRNCHIDLIDEYDKSIIVPIKKDVAYLFDEYKSILKRIKEKERAIADYNQKKEFLDEQIKEIRELNLRPREDEDLLEKLTEAQNREKLYDSLSKIYELSSSEDFSLFVVLSKIQNEIKNIERLSNDARELGYEFSDIYFKIEDLINKIGRARDKIIFSSEDLEQISDRLDIIERMKRKYNTNINGILRYLTQIESQSLKLKNTTSDLKSIYIERDRIGEMLKAATERLTVLRNRAAKSFENKVQQELTDLNFKDASVKVKFDLTDKYTANGRDDIEFLISTNAGEPLKPLIKIASGGEISRIMLAFKGIIGDYDNIGTMIFDEIDSGVSGLAANSVGRKLKSLSYKHQVIAITHLPQIAAMADHNYKIEKTTDGFITKTQIKHLSDNETVAEIARLLSGNEISDIAIENAKNLIKNS